MGSIRIATEFTLIILYPKNREWNIKLVFKNEPMCFNVNQQGFRSEPEQKLHDSKGDGKTKVAYRTGACSKESKAELYSFVNPLQSGFFCT